MWYQIIFNLETENYHAVSTWDQHKFRSQILETETLCSLT